jgi:hypothetical protein
MFPSHTKFEVEYGSKINSDMICDVGIRLL